MFVDQIHKVHIVRRLAYFKCQSKITLEVHTKKREEKSSARCQNNYSLS